MLLNTTAPGAATPSFGTQQTFGVGGQPAWVTAADLNGDGKADLIVANFNDNTVSVLLNTTPAPTTTFDGNSFATQQTFIAGIAPRSVTAADLNGDGKPDLIVANENLFGNTVSVLLNTTSPGAATPSFATEQSVAVVAFPTMVTVADVNGDGKPDLIMPNQGDNTVGVLLNTTAPGATSPGFASQQTFAAGNLPESATAADVNDDGKPDLIVANTGDGTVSVLLNTTVPGAATPSFATQQTFATGSSPRSVTAADVNGDGLPDLIVANLSDNMVSVLLNTTAPGATTPSFAIQQTFATGTQPFMVTAADINGDGRPDLIVGYLSGNTVSVLLNTTTPGAATPSFATQQTVAVGSKPLAVTAADVNGDGKPDLIVTNFNDNTVSVLLNATAPGATTPGFTTQMTFAANGNPRWVTAADVNGDGKPDLIVANDTLANTVSVLLNTLYVTTASGSPATGTIHYNIPQTTIFVPASLALGSVPVGDTVTKNLTVKNTGTHPLYIYSVTSNDAEFAATGATTCPAGGLAPLATCTIAIGFTPSALGARSGTLSVTDNTATSPQHVAVSGTGTVDLTTSVTSVTWPNVKFGTPVTKSFSVTNHQNIAVPITKNITGLNAADFSVSGGTCGSTIAAKTTCSIAVKFAAGALGSESATIAISDGPDPQSPHNVSLFVPGTIPATVTPLSVLYGTITETSAQIKNVTVINKSPFTISVSSVVGGADPADFSVVGGCGPTLAGNSSCQIAVMFQPTDVGTRSGTLAVSIGQDPTSPHNVSLTGTGM